MTSRIFWEDFYVYEFTAIIEEISGNKVRLDQTAFHPQGGNQPSDKGFLKIGEKTLDVLDVQEDGQVIWHELSEEIDIGLISKEVLGSIDIRFRFSLMKNHTAQHLISGLFESELDISTTEAHIYSSHSAISFSRSFDVEELEKVMIKANKAIIDDLRVISSISSSSLAEEAKVRSKAIPSNDQIRTVKIEEIDATFCSGTHVKSLGELGVIGVKKRTSNSISIVCSIDSLEIIAMSNTHMANWAFEESQKISQTPNFISDRLKIIPDYKKQVMELSASLIDAWWKTQFIKPENDKCKLIIAPYENLPRNAWINGVPEIPDNVYLGVKTSERIFLIFAGEKVPLAANDLVTKIVEANLGKGGGSKKLAQLKPANFETISADITALFYSLFEA
ncbi:MAG: alanyl-tRNA editing protein [Candidatus Heimdallarchaeota archaeon]|nr:alanyl-tRNA editing protein [Candidatus Heimdallarchaeota archaeon]MCK5047836.1 alanyl-tRNA editing protein [Candidatus Heimdallarchaeota archaeon]